MTILHTVPLLLAVIPLALSAPATSLILPTLALSCWYVAKPLLHSVLLQEADKKKGPAFLQS